MGQEQQVIDITIDGSVEGDVTVTGERIILHICGDVSGNVIVTQSVNPANVTISGEPYDATQS